MVEEDIIVKFLAGEAEEHEVIKLSEWRKSSTQNEQLFLEIQSVWEKSIAAKKVQKLNTDLAWNKVNLKIEERAKKVIPFRTYWAIAASIVLLIGLSMFWLPKNEDVLPIVNRFESKDSTKTLAMIDGSVITMKHGELEYDNDFNATSRKVNFKRGTAYFKIQKDSSKPFLIQCNGSQVSVLGTAFEITTNKLKTIVKVNEGRVKFTTADGEFILSKGMGAEYDGEKRSLNLITGLQNQQYAYATGELKFVAADLNAVVKELEMNFPNTDIVLEEGNYNCAISATFNSSEKIEGILAVLVATIQAEMKVSDNGKTIFIKGGHCQK